MDDRARQLWRERNSIVQGVQRYYDAAAVERARGRQFDGAVGQRFVRNCMKTLIPELVAVQRISKSRLVLAQTVGQRLSGWEMPILTISPPYLAYIVLKTTLTAPADDHRAMCSKLRIAAKTGRMVNLQLRWDEVERAEKAAASEAKRPNRVNLMKRRVKQINPKSIRGWLKKMDDLTTTIWSNEVRVKLGLVLIEALMRACPDAFFERDTEFSERGRLRTLVNVGLTEAGQRAMDDDAEDLSADRPWDAPMVCPPQDWAWSGSGGNEACVGGYLSIPYPVIKTTRWKHTAAIMGPKTVPAPVLEALNHVQRTRWRINSAVLAVALAAQAHKLDAILPVASVRELPPNLPAAVWDLLSPKERGILSSRRRRIHDHNNRLENTRRSLKRKLAVAQELVTEPVIYFPHNLDFRGRVYPLPQDLHPQADDISRSLLSFADSKPLGRHGLRWLCYYAANCYGVDKVSREEQYQWVIDHLDDLARVARDPLATGLEFFAAAEKPWQFLSAAIELEGAFSCMHPAAFESSLPIQVDGSCNGLQHLSAMGRDPVGAHATNLTADPERQDIYQIVADKVSSWVDYEAGLERHPDAPCWNWQGRVTRKTVKRGVMTVPYGLTKIGMRDQLISDRHTEGLPGDVFTNASYLRDLMLVAISDTVQAGTDIMRWLRDNAEILAANGLPVDWTTPSGFRVRQAYYPTTAKRVKTVVGTGSLPPRVRRMYLTEELVGAGVQSRRQSNSIVPNVIHSFDAAHLMLTVNKAARDLGLSSFSVIHDSFGVHACDMQDFSRVLREVFVNIYRDDWFTLLQVNFETLPVAGEINFIKPPALGSHDISEVLGAEFFFA